MADLPNTPDSPGGYCVRVNPIRIDETMESHGLTKDSTAVFVEFPCSLVNMVLNTEQAVGLACALLEAAKIANAALLDPNVQGVQRIVPPSKGNG